MTGCTAPAGAVISTVSSGATGAISTGAGAVGAELDVSAAGAGVISVDAGAGVVPADLVDASDREDECRDAFSPALVIVEFTVSDEEVAAMTAPRIAGSRSAGSPVGSGGAAGGTASPRGLVGGGGAPTVSTTVGTLAKGSAGAGFGFARADG